MKKARFIKISFQFFLMTIFFVSCQKHKCDNGKQDGNETSIDCGGDCVICLTCDDGIKNANETDVDCGGECQTCIEKYEKELLGTWYLDSSYQIVYDQGNSYRDYSYFLDPSTCKMTFTYESGTAHHLLYGNMFECDPLHESEWWLEGEQVWVEAYYDILWSYHPGHYITNYKLNGEYEYSIYEDILHIYNNVMGAYYHR